MKKIIEDRRGFTFIELILSITLLGIISIFVLSGIQFAMETLYVSERYMKESYELQSELEQFVGTMTSAEKETDFQMHFTWSSSASVPDFKVKGDLLNKTSESRHLRESFFVFVPYEIEPLN